MKRYTNPQEARQFLMAFGVSEDFAAGVMLAAATLDAQHPQPDAWHDLVHGVGRALADALVDSKLKGNSG